MTSEQARELYKQSGLNYSDIGSKEIANLMTRIEYFLCADEEKTIPMRLSNCRNKDITYKIDGGIKNAFIMVDSDYFKRREAISFNTQSSNGEEFIGFAGWASSKNLQPFLKAFESWINWLVSIK